MTLHPTNNNLLLKYMNKAIIFIFAALLTTSCVGRQETASEEKGDHVNTFIYSNDTLTIEPVNGDCMAPYPFGFQKPLADYRKDFSFLKENKTSDYQCIQNYYRSEERRVGKEC